MEFQKIFFFSPVSNADAGVAALRYEGHFLFSNTDASEKYEENDQ